MESTFLIDEFAQLKPGEPIRLFPFGRVVKGGKIRNITPEMAKQFKLPHFKPPIKLGSHEEVTPAGAFIKGLFVGDDGLYADIEVTDKGEKVLQDGDYRYHSPEVIWEDGAIEHPETGELIEGPLIVGDALLHTPHLGEAAALYEIEPFESKGAEQMTETVSVPLDLWENIKGMFQNKPEPEPETDTPAIDPEEFSALKAKAEKADELEAKLQAEAEKQARADRVAHFEAEVEEVEALDGDEELAEMLADLPEETANVLLTKIKALGEQVKLSALEDEIGKDSDGLPDSPMLALDARIKAYAAEHDVTYNEAVSALRETDPEAFEVVYR